MLQNILGQYWERLSTGFKLGGGTAKRYLTVKGSSDTEITGGSTAYTRAYLNKNYLVGEQRIVGNGAFFDNGCIHGKATLELGTYAGNATLRDITMGFFPLFYVAKPNTAVAGAMWTYMGGNKGGAIANTVDYCKGVSTNGLGVQVGTGVAMNTNLAPYNWFGFGAHDGSLTGMKAKVGNYTGTGSAFDIDVTDFGDPDVVLIKGEGAFSALFRTSNATYSSGTISEYFVVATASLATQGIVSMTSTAHNGFRIGTSVVINTNGSVYNYLMLKKDATGTADIALKQFIGQAGDGLHVDLPFQPNFMFLIPGASTTPMMWFSSQTAGNTSYVSAGTADVTDAVVSADPYGFTMDGSAILNVTNVPCNVLAIKCDY